MKALDLYEQLQKAEQAEQVAKNRRAEIEEKIFNSLKHQLLKTEGQETIQDHDWNITISQPMTYKLDEEKYKTLVESMPEELQCHRIKIELDKKLFDHVKNDKKFGKKIMDCVSFKPGKISVRVNKNEN